VTSPPAARAAAAVQAREAAGSGSLERVASDQVDDTAWDALALRSGNVFATREWLRAWWTHLGRGDEILLQLRHDVATAIVPLVVWRRGGLRVLRFAGHGPSDELGPIVAPEDRPVAADALRRWFSNNRRGADVLVGEYLPGSGWGRMLGGRVLRRHASPVLRLDAPTWDDFLMARSRNFREQARRRVRTLARRRAVHFRRADDPERLAADVETLIRLHDARWGGRSSAFAGARAAFHAEFAAAALRRGWLRLWFLEVDGRAVAAWYGFRFAGRESYYQSGRDLDYDHLSVGTVLLLHSIRAALEDGIDEYRFLRGDEAYKYRFAVEDDGVETVALASSIGTRAALAVAGKASRVRPLPQIVRRALDL
jgi:CelD/BcsL family acetyltransferase involved in cellulose biosynthesis